MPSDRSRLLDARAIRLITLFEEITGAQVRDCLPGERVYFLVADASRAIGKRGGRVKRVERLLGKPVKVLEYSSDPRRFIMNLVPGCLEVELDESKARVRVAHSEKAKLIGRGGSNLRAMRELLKRNAGISLQVI